MQISFPQSWKDYCLDLKDTDLYSHLSDKSLAVTDGDGVYGIPYAVEGYGIIYNQEIMDKYIALSNKKADITSVDDINNFDILIKDNNGINIYSTNKNFC